MTTALTWRGMMMFNISVEDDVVSICMKEDCDMLDGFIDIYTDVDDAPSPFKTVDDAKFFAEIIVKLLGAMT